MLAEGKEINSTMTRSSVLLMLLVAILLPVRTFTASNGLRDCSPQAINRERVTLYFAAAREPLIRLAPQVYLFAADSERCRLNEGAKPCGLPDDPLKSTDLQPIFNYYVKQPVEAALGHQQIQIRKRDWIWQPYVKQH
jgi:hypothetical protein